MPVTSLIGMNSPMRHFARTSAASALGCDADTATRAGAPLSGVTTGASDATGGFVGDVVEFGGSVTTAPSEAQPTRANARAKSATSAAFFIIGHTLPLRRVVERRRFVSLRSCPSLT